MPELDVTQTRGGDAQRPSIFFYDLADPESYLAAERIMGTLPIQPEWEPVRAVDLGIEPAEWDRDAFAARVAAQALQPLRWPAVWPPDARLAMLTATYAKRVGRAVAYSLAAYRQAFAGGRDLGDENTVLLAAAACEMHPTAVLKGLQLRSVSRAQADAVARATAVGVGALPAITVGELLFTGADAVEAAALALADPE